MGITNLIVKLFGVDAAAPLDAMKLDGTTEAALARSLSALPPDKRGWITFARREPYSRRSAWSTPLASWTKAAEKKSRRSRRTKIPPSALCRLKRGSISYRSDRCDKHCSEEFPHPLTCLVLRANVRFAPKSRHRLTVLGCPLCARSRHSPDSQLCALLRRLMPLQERACAVDGASLQLRRLLPGKHCDLCIGRQ